MTIKFYQQNKAGIETFALRMEGENLSEKIGNALFELGSLQRKWQDKGIRFSGFALSKPVYFFANGKVFNAEISAELKLKLKFRKELTLPEYIEFASDCVKAIGL